MPDTDFSISAEEMQVWRSDPTTRKLLKQIRSARATELNALESGRILVPDNPYTTHANVAIVMGKVEGLNAIIEMMQEKPE